MLNKAKTLLPVIILAVPSLAFADLFYDEKKDKEMQNLTEIESARITAEYLCGDSALYINANAASTEISGRHASLSGKIVSKIKVMT